GSGGKIYIGVFFQNYQFRTVIAYHYSIRTAAQHAQVIAAVTGNNKITDIFFPFIAEVMEGFSLSCAWRYEVKVVVIGQKQLGTQLAAVKKVVHVSQLIIAEISF